MFEELFTRPATIQEYHAAPLADQRLRYLFHCAKRGARPCTLRKVAAAQLSCVRLLDLHDTERVSHSRIHAAARKWSRPRGRRCTRAASPSAAKVFVGHATRWLAFVDQLEPPDKVRHDYTAEVLAFANWARTERGLSEATIDTYCRAADHFLDWLSAVNISLASVKSADIDRLFSIMNAKGKYRRSTIKNYATRLQAFFRFAEDRLWCKTGTSAAIRPPRVYPDEGIAKGLCRDDVVRLLATTDRELPIDKRDRAILMLLTAYALRAQEVLLLQLQDIDWANETLMVRRPKAGRSEVYPLSRGVGQALVRYLTDVRPSNTERTIFLTLRAPLKPLSSGALGSIVRNRLKRIGVLSGRRGPHSLRHAAAQHLLDRGMSYKEIGDFLGHRASSSTAVYAKLNLGALREVSDFDLEGLI